MQPLLLPLRRVIATTAAITLTYLFSVLLPCRLEIVLSLYGVTLLATVWMVLRILKDPYSTDKTFTDYFYQDREDLRRCGTKSSPQ
jgi:hypothetical protein